MKKAFQTPFDFLPVFVIQAGAQGDGLALGESEIEVCFH
jgi:hypothetical protein